MARVAPAGTALVAVLAAILSASPVRSALLDGDAVELLATQRVQQVVAIQGGALYAVTTDVVATGAGTVELRLTFFDGGFIEVGPVGRTVSQSPFQTVLSTSAAAPPSAAFAEVAIILGEGDVRATVRGTTLSGPPPATPTQPPAATMTPAPSPTAPSTPASSATPTPPPVSTAPPATPPTSPATTPTPTATATARATPGPSATPAPSIAPPTLVRPPATVPALSGFGGLLANGDFEAAADGVPLSWHEFGGGDLRADGPAHRGERAAHLAAAPGTTWVHQLVAVSGGAWYTGRAWASVEEGVAEVRIRLSWYASGDGSGTALGQVDSPAHGGGWKLLDTGQVRAPAGARSVRFRLMVRSAGGATVAFDDAELFATAPPSPTPAAGPAPARTPVSSQPPVAGAGSPPPATSVAAGEGPGLRISEVLPDPVETGRDSAFEWVELVNTGSSPIDLAGWRLGDAVSSDALPSAVVPPGGYVVVAGRDAALGGDDMVVIRVSDGEIGNGINNSGDALYLIAPGGVTVDAMSFGSNTAVFASPPAAPPAGSTLGVRDPAAAASAANWDVTLGPSPGRPNTFAPRPAPAATTAVASPVADRSPGATRLPGSGANPGATPDATDRSGRGSGRGSAAPALIAAGVVGAGIAGAAVLGRQAWPALRDRVRRRGR